MFEPIHQIEGAACVLNHQDVDTDRIIPARFLTTIERAGLGRHLFVDWREHDSSVESALQCASREGATVLIAGPNFGCGSSREHAVWALADYGFRCVIAPSFADIFEKNAYGNGLVPVRVGDREHRALAKLGPGERLEVDLRAGEVRSCGMPIAAFEIPAFERECLGKGWDALDYLVGQSTAIRRFEERQGLGGR